MRSLAGILALVAAAGAALGGCVERTPGTAVTVTLAGTGAPPCALTTARLTVWAVALVPCDAEWVAPAPWAWLVGTAHAHSAASPLRSGTPYVVDLLGGAQPIAQISPPADRYCALTVETQPADLDAVGLADAPTHAGLSYALACPDDARQGASRATLTVPLDPPLHLHAGHLTDTVDLAVALDRWWVPAAGDALATNRATWAALPEAVGRATP